MKLLTRFLVLFIFFISLYTHSQQQNIDFDINQSPLTSILKTLPKISKDSTETEITNHVEAMISWMSKEYYKSSYEPILIYADKGLVLAKKSSNASHIHDVRSVIGNTYIRIKDTVTAKKLFLKSLEEAKKTNDSSIILKSKGNLANIYYYNDGYKEKTTKLYLESIEIALKLKDTTKLFILHHNLVRAFNELEDPERGAYHITQTELYLNLLNNPPHYKASHLHNIGRRFLLLDKPDEAIKYFKQTIAISKKGEFVSVLIEGYESYKEALEIKKDYKGIYEISEELESYKKKNEAAKENSIVESVTAKLNVERYKDQIKAKELEQELLEHQADIKTLLLFVVITVLIFISVMLYQTYKSSIRRKNLIQNLKGKNLKYLEEKRESDELTKAKTKFFATVSHELRTPLYGVIGLSSILLENNELQKHEKDLRSLKFSANYLLALVNDLLHMNKIESNNFSEEDSSFDIEELTETIVSSFEYIRVQHQNEIAIKIHKDVPAFLYGNSVRLSQILMNLIGNACKFTEKGEIVLGIKTTSKSNKKVKLQFTVSDTGPGIEKAKLNQIFDEFTQIDSMSTNYHGTGLGLPIVKKLVEQAGGEITVESDLGKGTIFNFNLEIKISREQNRAKSTPILSFKQLAEKHILIVEDNRINQTVTKRILENENVNCMIAQNGEEAVNMVKAHEFDLILMDINMPVKNGIEATKEIRTFNTQIPIIALTAVEIEEQKHKIFNCGMNDIVLKPYDIDKFKKAIILNLDMKQNETLKKLA